MITLVENQPHPSCLNRSMLTPLHLHPLPSCDPTRSSICSFTPPTPSMLGAARSVNRLLLQLLSSPSPGFHLVDTSRDEAPHIFASSDPTCSTAPLTLTPTLSMAMRAGREHMAYHVHNEIYIMTSFDFVIESFVFLWIYNTLIFD